MGESAANTFLFRDSQEKRKTERALTHARGGRSIVLLRPLRPISGASRLDKTVVLSFRTFGVSLLSAVRFSVNPAHDNFVNYDRENTG